jgi:serine/threonine-protein kinase
MLHRDIKPSNIGLSEVRDPVLLDFGLAHFFAGDSSSGSASSGSMEEEAVPDLSGEGVDQPSLRRTRTGRFRGTLSYLSPETLVGERQSPRSDLWSLCVVLYEAITGENPFLRPGGAARTSAPDLRISQPDCPPEVAEFFLRALSTDPSMRPSNAKELLQELEGIHRGLA